jgi:hypothetical protein
VRIPRNASGPSVSTDDSPAGAPAVKTDVRVAETSPHRCLYLYEPSQDGV